MKRIDMIASLTNRAGPRLAAIACCGMLACSALFGAARPEPTFFPNATRVYVPRGTAQLLKPYLPEVAGASEGYELRLQTPRWLRLVAVEPSLGDAPSRVRTEPGEAHDGVAYDRHVLQYDVYPSQGFELSICWADAAGKTLFYQPAIARGGTHDWRRVQATVKSPPSAAKARPLIIKHAGRGIRGTFWVDNVVFRRADRKENLLATGTFDEAQWKSALLKPESKDGSRCAKFVCPAEMAARQQALWLHPDREAFPVEPGTEYVGELDLTAEGLGSDGAQHVASLLFRAEQDAPEGISRIFTSASAAGRPAGQGRETELVILPPLRGVRPKQARIAPCFYATTYTAPQVNEALADNVWRSGITWTYGSVQNEVVKLLGPRGHRVWLAKPGAPFEAHGPAREVLGRRPELSAVSYDGKPIEGLFCPTWLLSAEGAEVRRLLESDLIEIVRRDGYAAVNWDIEQPVCVPSDDGKSTRGFCLCPRCLAAFRAQQRMAADAVLDGRTIVAKYKDAWVHFRCVRNAELVGCVRAALKNHDPKIEFSVYSGYQSEKTQSRYGVDWALLAPHLDLAIAGYGGTRSAIHATREALGNVPFIGGHNYYLSAVPVPASAAWMRAGLRATPNPLAWRNRLLQQFVDGGCRGVLIWQLPTMDGGTFYYTSEAAEIIATHEDLFCNGRRCDELFRIKDAKPEQWAALELGRQRLLLVMNPTGNETTVEVGQPGLQGSWEARVRGQALGGELEPSQFALTLEPWGTRVVLFSKH